MSRPWQDTNPTWLTAQYGNARPHADRIRLHTVCSQDPRGWYSLLFDQLRQRTPADAYVFELGCGSGELWKENLPRIPTEWKLHLTDIFPGMLELAKRHLRDFRNARFELIDGNDPLPFPSDRYDAAVANHMLYHLISVSRTIKEIHRIVKKNGIFIATTTGPNHMARLFEIVRRFEPRFPERTITPRTFDTINGATLLRKEFTRVERTDCLDTLKIKEEHAQLAVDYIYSWHDARAVLPEERRTDLLTFFKDLIRMHGPLLIEKEQAIFLATK